MSIPQRIARLSKAYYNQFKDKIDNELAERELAVTHPQDLSPDTIAATTSDSTGRSASASAYDSDPDSLLRRAEEKVAQARRDLEGRQEANRAATDTPGPQVARPAATSTSTGSGPKTVSNDPNAAEYRVLGLPVGADFGAVQVAYEQLAQRSDPARFPANSSEQRDAERILARVNAAYEALRRRLDPIENRFGRLELE